MASPVSSSGYTRSIVVPLYNEATRLTSSLEPLLAIVDHTTELVLVDDGSTDGTASLLERATAGRSGIRLVRLPSNRGKGGAVRAGVAVSSGDGIAFMDADLATNPDCLAALFGALATHDVAIGSRASAGAEIVLTSRLRSTVGGTFNQLVRAATRLPFRDTQCGFKAFRASAARMLFSLSRVDGFAFDVEILLLARALGYRIGEVPVEWTEVGGSHVRPVADPLRMSVDVFRSRSSRHRRRCVMPSVGVACSHGSEISLSASLAAALPPGLGTLDAPGTVHVLMPFATEPASVAVRDHMLTKGFSDLGVVEPRLGALDAEQIIRLVGSSPTGVRPTTGHAGVHGPRRLAAFTRHVDFGRTNDDMVGRRP
jgi:dolichyl-phosphate beta-glucosyltransferase